MKSLFSLAIIVFSFSSFAQFSQNIIIGKKADKFVSLCDFKTGSGLDGSAYFNVVGECAWDPAMNGEYLTLTVLSEDPTDDAYEVDLGQNVRSVKKVSAKKDTIKVEVVQDTFNAKEQIVQVNKTITIVPQKTNKKFNGNFKITVK